MQDLGPSSNCSRRSSELKFRGAALVVVPYHSFATAIGEVHHVPRCSSMVSDLSGLITRLSCANRVDEIRKMQNSRVRLVCKLQILWYRLTPCSL